MLLSPPPFLPCFFCPPSLLTFPWRENLLVGVLLVADDGLLAHGLEDGNKEILAGVEVLLEELTNLIGGEPR